MKLNMKKSVPVEARTFALCLKVSDRFAGTLLDQYGAELITVEETYVPDFFPGNHYGDYVELNIDVDTGMIINWVPPTQAQLEAFINSGDE